MTQQATPSNESRKLIIKGQDKILELFYSGVKEFHKHDSWFGCTVGFRALQAASGILSQQSTWAREHLYVVTGIPGQGVLDAIEYVTRCISAERFALLPVVRGNDYTTRDMRFEWWISNGRGTVHVTLRPELVPESFYDLLNRLRAGLGTEEEKHAFKQFKADMGTKLWTMSLSSIFLVEHSSEPLAVGAIPD
ncbi:MAG: hypothetical protein AAGI38_04555 [Bacteroidota bacterium]